MHKISDNGFRLDLVSRTDSPNTTVFIALTQDYGSGMAIDSKIPSETRCGEFAKKCLLHGDRGHFGPFEHPQIILNAGGFPHSVIQQLRTHRLGTSFDVQSGRYTGEQIEAAGESLNQLMESAEKYTPGIWQDPTGEKEAVIQSVVYLRKPGHYMGRSCRYEYSKEMYHNDLALCAHLIQHYTDNRQNGISEEHARGFFAFDIRQNFVISLNMRSMMHLLDLRAKKDAQLECQLFCELLMGQFEAWSPQLADWYREHRWGKARLSP